MMRKITFILVLSLTVNICHAPAQQPIADYLGRYVSRITAVVSEAVQVLNNLAEPLINTYASTKEFLDKAETVVNASIKNMYLIENSIKTHNDIANLYDKSLTVLNSIGNNPDDSTDYSALDKIKHLEILLALSKQSIGGFSIFTNLLEEDAFTMDDKNRLEFLVETYKDLRRIKSAMRVEMKRVNRQIMSIKRLQGEKRIFVELFQQN